jgi:hypothetical protein
VGARSFVVTKTDINQQLIWGKTYPADDLRRLMPAMVRTAAVCKPCPIPDGETVMAGENLIIRPIGPGVAFVQLDDLNAPQLDRIGPAAFIIHATSPGNHQAWIAVSGVPEGKEAFQEFMRRVRKAVGGNDKSASHATRVAGTQNFKPKYAPAFPTVSIVETHSGRVMTPEQLEALGLLAPPEPVKPLPLKFASQAKNKSGKERHWPSYEMSLAGAPRGSRRPRPQPGGLLVVLPRPPARMERRGDGGEAPGGKRESPRAGEATRSWLCPRDGNERRRMAGAQPAAEPGLMPDPCGGTDIAMCLEYG